MSCYVFTIMIMWSRKWQPTPIFLPGESHGQRGLVATIYGVTSIGYDRATNYMHTYTHTHTHIYVYVQREILDSIHEHKGFYGFLYTRWPYISTYNRPDFTLTVPEWLLIVPHLTINADSVWMIHFKIFLIMGTIEALWRHSTK